MAIAHKFLICIVFAFYFTSTSCFSFRLKVIQKASPRTDDFDFDPRVSPHSYGTTASTEDSVGIIIVDHGSRRDSANLALLELVKTYKTRTGRRIVEAAHMELAAPTIKEV